MSFISLGFLLFLFVGIIVYYILPKKLQWVWLLIISYFYYACSGLNTIVFIIVTTVTTFLGALAIEAVSVKRQTYLNMNKNKMSQSEKKAYKADTKHYKRLLLVLILIINFGILAVIKYYGFMVDNLNSILVSLFHVKSKINRIDFLLPLGISFYTFQSMGYIIDIYQGKYKADRNIFKFALFVSYFPQILQGPIGRYNKLAHQFFEKHYFSLVQLQHGLQLMLWGYLKKMVLSDRAAIIANEVFCYGDRYGGIIALFGVLAYGLQLYADFSGGMDIVIGISEILGINLDSNFRQPYFSNSISDFWHRWHITLGTWMKDYVFYPFSLSRVMTRFGKFTKKLFGTEIGRVLPICMANLLIFFIVGVWHGSEWHYILYGLYNGFLISIANLFEPLYPKMFRLTHINSNSKKWKIVRIIRTFCLVTIGWYFDRAGGVRTAFSMLKNTITGFTLNTLVDGSLLRLGVKAHDYVILALGCIVWFVISFNKEKGVNIREAVDKKILPIRWAIYVALIMTVVLLGEIGVSTSGFMYAKF